ncbi:MAG: FG-GAP-like repeat-containing protein [Bacteroidia bacterium]|nr:FG-GAP-like repeat-containing protein [Bacteroidia bacterium]MDW8158880.1 FG-GAP-like repeat-containing protein [Bacteroidia bacterium]
MTYFWALKISLLFLTIPLVGQIIQIQDAQQRTLKYPFSGGLNNPQFSNIDIDQDGRLDLFIFDKSDRAVLIFQNNDSGYTWQPSWSSFFPLNELEDWVLLRDFNCDGKIDIFTGNNSQVKVFKNVSSERIFPRFVLYQDALPCRYLDEDSWVYIAGSDIPGIADIDEDGDSDIIAWDVTGSWVNAYKNFAQELYNRCDTLVMVHTSSCWGNFQEFYNADSNYYDVRLELEPCSHNYKISHIGGALLPIHLNGDSLIDVLISDNGLPEVVGLFNGGTRQIAKMVTKETQFPKESKKINIHYFPALFSVQLGKDTLSSLIAAPNQLDILEDRIATWLYRNYGSKRKPVFIFQDSAFLQKDMLDFGTGSLPAVGDLNGDSYLDILVGTASTYLGGNQSAATLNVLLQKPTIKDSLIFYLFRQDFLDLSRVGLSYFCPTLADLDADGDNDLLLGINSGEMYYYENIATKGQMANFLLRSRNYLRKAFNETIVSPCPTLWDLDGDKDLDLLVGTAKGTVWLYENTGTSKAPFFVKRTERWGQISVTDWDNTQLGRARPLLQDFDQDGAPDLLIGNASGKLLYASPVCLLPTSKLHLDTLPVSLHTQNIAPAFLRNQSSSFLLLGTQRGGISFQSLPSLRKNNSSACPYEVSTLEWQVYPNPARNEITIKASAGSKIEWYNTLGKIIQTTELLHQNEITIPTHNLPNGIYFLKKQKNDYQKVVIINDL